MLGTARIIEVTGGVDDDLYSLDDLDSTREESEFLVDLDKVRSILNKDEGEDLPRLYYTGRLLAQVIEGKERIWTSRKFSIGDTPDELTLIGAGTASGTAPARTVTVIIG